ncbi:MAG: flagellar hook-basal body protein [Planctomycetes bacterium]|nr:flagellar hook-basal body protein [Planctomycetota bacterium]
MPYGMYIAATGAEAQNRILDVLANNLANIDTPGFKHEIGIIQARHAEAIERGEVPAGSRTINDVGGGVALKETITDFSRGTLKPTGVKTDLAIADSDGNAFFVIERDGERLLTRAGNFRFSSSGQLQTQNGDAVLSTDGQPVAINPALPFNFTADGGVQQGDELFLLALERPASFGDLAKAGTNLFKPLADTVPLEEGERSVKTGFLEMSTVKPTQAMMELIKATRTFEANIKMIQHQDQMMGSLVNRVLRSS